METKKHIAFFDLDYTILNDSSSKLMGVEAFKKGLFKKRHFAEGALLLLAYKSRLMKGEKIISRMLHWLKGLSAPEVFRFAQDVFQTKIRQAIRPCALHEIKRHQKIKTKVVLLTASVSFLAQQIAEYLKIDDIICTDLEIINNHFTGNANGDFCFDRVKLERAKKYCKTHNYSLRDSYYYGDSISDLPILEAVGNPKCVSPDKWLRKEARVRAWSVCNW